ncbi:MAG TPA: xanthine dehydrogenase family protein molybdopterin-binding subunit [Hyphomicrobiaceae bacterium]|nr:xanthine dehydrogenase family protein molybdopterin-binding subunit [Hyphomicrobiaceae bacterium]
MERWAEFQGRIEDTRLLAGCGLYVADIAVPGLAHAVVVRAQVASARVSAIDIEGALAVPGVLAVYTAKDLAADGLPDFPCGVNLPGPDGRRAHQAQRPILVRDRIRAVGEPVAFVVAETLDAATAAAELVLVETEDRAAVASPADARAASAAAVWDEVPDNIAFVWQRGKAADGIGRASHVARLSSHVSRVAALSLEPRAALGRLDEAGRLVLHASTQSPHILQRAVASLLKLPADRIRVIAKDVGGSFGMKSGAYPEDVLVLYAARKLGRPVRWIAERRESFLADDHGRDVAFEAELGLDSEGRFLALKVDFTVNVGCYLSGRSLFLLNNVGGIAGVYRIADIEASITGVFTNTMTNAPYRGAGRPEATYVIERLIDIAARELGLDPFELRRRNLVPPSAMPYDTGFLFTYDCGEFEGNMTGAAKLADRAGFPRRRQQSQSRGLLRGLGMANPIEVAAGPFSKPRKDLAKLAIDADGTATLFAGSMSTGQGIETTLTDLVARELGLPREAIRYQAGDTDDLPDGRGNGGSGAIAVGGSAVKGVIAKVIESGRALAAELLEAEPDEIGFADGRFPLQGSNRSVSLGEVARHARAKDPLGLAETAEYLPPAVTFPNGCHMVEVELDPQTGVVEIVRYSIVEDLGNVLNRTLAEGQIQGGVAMGIGQALGEMIRYDSDSGQLITGSFMDYQMPRAAEIPRVDLKTRAVPTAANPLGAKGVGEAGTVGALVATINAICDALAPLGIRHLEMPATPARVWAAIEAAKSAQR